MRLKAPQMTDSDDEMFDDVPVMETQPRQDPNPTQTQTQQLPIPTQSLHSVNNLQPFHQPPVSYSPSIQGDLMGTPRVFGPRNPDMSPRTFIKAIKRCWALNPNFFINDAIKIAFAATRLSGSAEIWFSVLEDRDDPSIDNWDRFESNFVNEFSTTRNEWQTRVDLVFIRQKTKTINEYTAQFRTLSNQLNFGDEALLTLYFLGLNPQIQQYIESLHTMPVFFNDIVATALDYGSRSLIRRSPYPPSSASTHQRNLPHHTGDSFRPMDISNINRAPQPLASNNPRGPLTSDEKAYRLNSNLCLYCGSAQHLVDSCPVRPSKNF